ncbi:transcription termination factor Rho [Mariniblastus fucicola]|uniref:Transcription termination factor Rho n=1 Tax=Mariniblastus fucicola TaxID=980251 RepID=A0A5B9PGX2_9BACT|nr:transcription termination factor Rho [Mariniblastus fucicola]QEG24510.1 hypothetical protein MFFC18_44300 [Mariniblastus fucicola]
MAVGKTSNPKPDSAASANRDSDTVDTFVDVSEYQKLDDRQLNALLSQHKISVDKDASSAGKIRAVIDRQISLGHKLVGAGTLQVLPDGFGFLRSRWFNYLGGPDDIYVSPSQIRKFSLTNGDLVSGQIRPPKENERFFALLRVLKVNDMEPSKAIEAPEFDDLSPLAPNRQILTGAPDSDDSCRIVDLVSPIGFGQRGIIVSPPRSGKTRMVEQLCQGMLNSDSNVYAYVLLVDQRPEEITELERKLNGPRCEVISSVFDESSFRHHDVAMMVLEKAKRMVELGEHVVIFLDSLTNLARFELGPGYLANRLEPDSLPRTRSFLASARLTEEAGSLTIIGTLTTNSTNELDDLIAEILRSTSNMEIQLDHELVKRRIWPAINVHLSQCQQEEVLLGDQYGAVCKLRRKLGDLSAPEAMDLLLSKIESSDSNEKLLGDL